MMLLCVMYGRPFDVHSVVADMVGSRMHMVCVDIDQQGQQVVAM